MFKALADPTRRALLDELFGQDGQNLAGPRPRFDMTRIGVAKHLGLLEAAGLVVTRRRGREKLHFLNPVPIRLVHDRWVGKYTEPWVAGLGDLKTNWSSHGEGVRDLHPDHAGAAVGRDHRPDIRARYHFGNRIESDWAAGIARTSSNPDADGPLVEGENVEVDPPRRLVQTMLAVWGDDVGARERRGSRGRSSRSVTPAASR